MAEITYKILSNARRIVIFEDKVRLCSIDLEASITKIIPSKDAITVLLCNTKMQTFDLKTGSMLSETAHDGSGKIKTEKQRRKEIYISRLNNEKRANGR